MTTTTALSDITLKTIQGDQKALKDYLGNVLLIVNVASYCGYTSQYRGLEALNQKYRDRGLRILGFPCNDFGNQEPDSLEKIEQFCTNIYGVSFEMFEKLHAKGADQHPLYAYLTKAVQPSVEVSWNFEKFLVSRQGEVVGHFRSSVTPDSSQLVSAIEAELAKA